MDKFRRKQQKNCDVGGIHCSCCNKYEGKERAKLNKLARKQLKEKDRKDNIDMANEKLEDEEAERNEKEAEEKARLYNEEVMFWKNLGEKEENEKGTTK